MGGAAEIFRILGFSAKVTRCPKWESFYDNWIPVRFHSEQHEFFGIPAILYSNSVLCITLILLLSGTTVSSNITK